MSLIQPGGCEPKGHNRANPGRFSGSSDLQVSVDHAHLVTVEHRLQDLLDTVAADRGQTPPSPSTVPRSATEERRFRVLPGVGFAVIFSGYNVFKQLAASDSDAQNAADFDHAVQRQERNTQP